MKLNNTIGLNINIPIITGGGRIHQLRCMLFPMNVVALQIFSIQLVSDLVICSSQFQPAGGFYRPTFDMHCVVPRSPPPPN